MKEHYDCSLKSLNTFGVEARAERIIELESLQDIASTRVGLFKPESDLVLGGGSNLLLTRDIEGTVFLNRLKGMEIVEDDGDEALVDVASGENWHEFVLWTLDQDLCGLENLSLIPGLAGAAPMQNIGAYGV